MLFVYMYTMLMLQWLANKKKKLTPRQRFIANMKSRLFWFASSEVSVAKSKGQGKGSMSGSATGKNSSVQKGTGSMVRSNRVGADPNSRVLDRVEEGTGNEDKDVGEIRTAVATTVSTSGVVSGSGLAGSLVGSLVGSLRNNAVAPFVGTSQKPLAESSVDGDLESCSTSTKGMMSQLSSKSKRAVLTWSGKVMNIRESQTFFQLLHGEETAEEGHSEGKLEEEMCVDLVEKVATLLPDQFAVVDPEKAAECMAETSGVGFEVVGDLAEVAGATV